MVRGDWTLLWNRRWLQLTRENARLELVGRRVTVREKVDGQVEILYRARKLPFKELPARPTPTRLRLENTRKEKRRGASNDGKEEIKKLTSPWRRFGFAAAQAYWKKTSPVAL